ncbi:hypothetical protein HYR54_00305 [Candidatus Acetothermia bacterium]|nr:hypothetical protein [Candidatus Acetothermia bacterium]MBI3459655.1 hypothetical protein [Candidatus Acetothermia bacterium]MBI3659859.1 hypothetical protein [Candidatus Acetothermia bacterium]
MQAFGIVILLAAVGLLGFLFFNGTIKVTDRPPPTNCAATETPAPSGAYKHEASFSLYDGKIVPERVDLSGPIIFISVTGFSPKRHTVVLASVKNCQEQELRRIEDIVNSLQAHYIKISLPPGEYLLYCVVREGKLTHRDLGEIAKIIVH